MGKACMGGRAAQQLCLTTVDTGASNDFERAYEIAQHIVVTYGMSTKLGPLSTGGRTSITGHSRSESFKPGPALQDEIDKEVLRLVNSWMDEAKRIICQEKRVVEAAVAVLLERKTMLAEEWMEIFKRHATINSGDSTASDEHAINCQRCNVPAVAVIAPKAQTKEAPVRLRLALVNVIQAAANLFNQGSEGTTKS
jgi:cell division protease FtsH